jgi:hypothetical protein
LKPGAFDSFAGAKMNQQFERLVRLAAKFESNAKQALYAKAKRSAPKKSIEIPLSEGTSDLAKAFQKEFPDSKEDISMLAPKKIGNLIDKLKSIVKKNSKYSASEIEVAKRKLHFLIYRHQIDSANFTSKDI